ncbi:hypothetical protein [Candidatus Korobacter versatilis]|nr:hypothetical protein [Candidatus Koribacter versatilis]
MKRLVLRVGIGVALALGPVGAVDLATFYARKAMGRNVYDTVAVDVVDVIPQKGNKAEYVPQGVQNVSCVRSLLPHENQHPCWYVRRNAVQEVKY